MRHRTNLLTTALFVVLLTLPAMWPFLAHSDYWVSHDGLFHLYRLLSLEEAWQQGYFYPRLFPDFAFGYGFAVLNFYGPLTYYVALGGRLLGLSSVSAMKSIFALSYPLAALSMWWLARDIWRREKRANDVAGIIAAGVYTYVPYHMADVQLRGALAESWAFVWWPWLFWVVWKGHRWGLALLLAALVLTHNLSVVLVGLPLFFWFLLTLSESYISPRSSAKPTQHDKPALSPRARGEGGRAGQGVRAGLIALALSAFYWLPVLLESPFVVISQDVGGLGFESHLAPLQGWMASGPSYRYFPDQGVAGEHPLSWAQVALLGLALLVGWRLEKQQRRVWLFWWAIFALTLFLVTPSSFFLWERFVFPFGMVQYPWRWLGITAIATAMLAGGGVAALKPLRRWRFVWATLLAWLLFSSMQYLPWEVKTVDLASHPVPMWLEDANHGQVGATWTAEFLPLTVQEQRWALARAPEVVEQVGERTELQLMAAGSDGFSLWADVEASETSWLTFPRFAYPSMQITIGEEKRDVVPRGVMGLAAVEVPPGRHVVRLDAFPLADKRWLIWGLALLSLSILGYKLITWRKSSLVLLPLIALFFWLYPQPDQQMLLTTSESKPLLFGNQTQLVALRHEANPKAGHPLAVRLLWFNLEQSDQRYNTFVHLTPLGGGPPLAQHDGEPNMGTIPTPRWQAGQLVEDLHLLPLPPDLPTGEYELWAGMYAIEGGEAVPLVGDSGERRFLGVYGHKSD